MTAPREPGFYWVRFPGWSDKDWTVARLDEGGDWEILGCEGYVDVGPERWPRNKPEWGPRIEPPSSIACHMTIEELDPLEPEPPPPAGTRRYTINLRPDRSGGK